MTHPPWHIIIIIRMLWDAARRCNLMTLGSLLTPDRKPGHQINTREGETAPTSLHLSTKICFTSKLLPKMFYSWAKSWEPTMNMSEWWNEKTKNINRNSMEHQYNIIHKPKTIKKLDCFTSSMKTIAHHHHSHFTTQTHSFKWHFKRSHEST